MSSINKVNKGYRFEKWCRDKLKSEGWLIGFKSQRIRFGKIDFFSLFDIVAFRNHTTHIEIEKERLYISCKVLDKGHGWLKQHKTAISEFKNNHGLEGERFEIWVKEEKLIRAICV